MQTESVRSKPSLKGCQDAGSAKHGVYTCQLTEPLTPAFHKSPLELAAPPRIMLQSQTVLIKAQVISLIKQQGHYQDFKSDTSTKVDFNKSRDCIGIMEKCVHQETLWGKIAGIRINTKWLFQPFYKKKVIKNTTSTKTQDSLKGWQRTPRGTFLLTYG